MTRGLTWDRLHFKSGDSPGDLPYEGLLLLPPPAATPPPLVVLPHGGPHSVTPADFMAFPVCFAALGFAVLMGMLLTTPTILVSHTHLTVLIYIHCVVNYRGSTGFGQDAIYSLPGNVGTNDVKDVQVHYMVKGCCRHG